MHHDDAWRWRKSEKPFVRYFVVAAPSTARERSAEYNAKTKPRCSVQIRGKVYSKGLDKKGRCNEQKIPLTIKGKSIL